MRNKFFVVVVFVCLATIQVSGCSNIHKEKVHPESWVDECIGYYQLAIPGEIEYALTRMRWLLHPPGFMSGFYYEDNAPGAFVTMDYDDGSFHVTKMRSEDDFQALENAVGKRVDAVVERYYRDEEKRNSLKKISSQGVFSWVEPGGFDTYLQGGDVVFHYNKSFSNQDSAPFYDLFHNSFRYRELYHIPDAYGACIPYGFIQGGDVKPRNIALMFRLKDHPDVEIFFQDQSARPPHKTMQGVLIDRSAEESLIYFLEWGYRAYAKRAVADWRGIHDVKIAGYDGKAMFATITRKDGAIDYGYFASVKGDYKAEEDRPNIMLYVARTASNAKGEPVTKEALREMAETIVALIKRR